MVTDKTWVDYWFVQATAWYLQLDMWIVATSSTDTNPYIEVSGNLADAGIPSSGPVVTLGTKSNCHYQSLLPIEMFHLEFPQNQQHSSNGVNEVKPCRNNEKIQGKYEKEFNKSQADEPNKKLHHSHSENIVDRLSAKKIDDGESYHPFIYEYNKKLHVFLRMSDDYTMKCPICLKDTKYIIQHISKSKN